jgi:hypothetical protein
MKDGYEDGVRRVAKYSIVEDSTPGLEMPRHSPSGLSRHDHPATAG